VGGEGGREGGREGAVSARKKNDGDEARPKIKKKEEE